MSANDGKHWRQIMAAIRRTEVEKVVRKVLDKEQGDANEEMLRALQRASELLRDKVIPQLPDQADDEVSDDAEQSDDEDDARGAVLEGEEPADVSTRGVAA